MKISAKIDYACRAMLELSLHWPKEEPLSMTVIADNQQIPQKFLTQIILSLKQAGLVESVRGKSGGYLLRKAPRDIRLSEVLELFESRDNQVCDSPFADVWAETDEAVWAQLDKCTLEDIRAKALSEQRPNVYVI